MKRMLRGILAIALSVVLSLTVLGDSVLASGWYLNRNETTGETCVYESEGVVVTFCVNGKWNGGYNAQVKISNVASERIDDWCVELKTADEITNLWNAKVIKKDGNGIVIGNDGWNQDIEPTRSVEFGYTSCSNFSGFPDVRMMPVAENDVNEDGYSFRYSVTDDWRSGFNGRIEIGNRSDETIREWQLSFEFKNEIQNIWNAEIISHVEDVYVVRGKDYNQNINAGEKTEIGFTVAFGSSKNEAKCISLSGKKVSTYDFSKIPFPKDDYYKDNDGDGVPNILEYFFGLDYEDEDSNDNGSSDYDALIAFLRCALADDGDGDGISDFSEYYYGLDPSKPCSFDDGVNDADRRMSVTMHGAESDENGIRPYVTLTTEGRHLDSFQVSKLEDSPLFNETIPGYFCNAYELSIDGGFDQAVLAFDVPESVMARQDFVPSIYYFNEGTGELEEVDGQYLDGNRICARLTHFSKYLLINKRMLESNLYPIEIVAPADNVYANTALGLVFSLDESGSLSSSDYGKMKNAAISLVDELGEDDSVSVYTFDDKIRKHCSFADKDDAAQVISNLTQHGGMTAIKDATLAAIDEFVTNGPEDVTKIIILLTDGYSNRDNTSLSYQQIAKKASDNGIIIYTIGVGSVSRDALVTLAENTEGQYYGIADFGKLNQIFQQVLIDAEVFFDSDYDGISDYHEKKIAQNQMRLSTGAEIPGYALMDYLNPDSDGDQLEDGQEMEIVQNERGVFVRFYSSPFLPDTDDDGFDDYAEDLMGTSPVDEFDPYVSGGDVQALSIAAMGRSGSYLPGGGSGGGKYGYKGVGTVISSDPSLLAKVSNVTWFEMAFDEYFWGYIHRQVQEHIYDNNMGLEIEQELLNNKRCDVIDYTNEMIWEVKPVTYYLNPIKQQIGKNQLNGYLNLAGVGFIHGDQSIRSYKFITKNDDYIVEYANAGDGMIYYSFERNKQKPDRPGVAIGIDDADDNSDDKGSPADGTLRYHPTRREWEDIAAMKRGMGGLEPHVIVVEKPSADIIIDIGLLLLLCSDDFIPGLGQIDDALAAKKLFDVLRKGAALLELLP